MRVVHKKLCKEFRSSVQKLPVHALLLYTQMFDTHTENGRKMDRVREEGKKERERERNRKKRKGKRKTWKSVH